jgi:peptidyl-prolyl cis-trans isomerase B (cyclophilin B)
MSTGLSSLPSGAHLDNVHVAGAPEESQTDERASVSTKRERELSRMRAERQAARLKAEAARARLRRTLVSSIVAVVLVVAAALFTVSKLNDGDGTPSAASGTCTWTPGRTAAKAVNPPSTQPNRTPAAATLATDRGTIVISLEAAEAPCAVTSFESLAGQGFFDDTRCHRLTTSGIFILQCGDPTGTGTGGPGYQFAEENLSGATYPRGTVAMAKSTAPGTSGSQFFLVYKDSALPPSYTPFGTITSGLDVLDTVAAAGASAADPKTGLTAPLLPITIVTARTSATTATPSAAPSASAANPGAN